MIKSVCIISMLLLVCFISSVTSANSGMAIMKVEPGARPSGLGGAFVSISGDPMSPIYNPAGAVGDSDFLFGVGYYSYWENISIQTGYIVGQISEKGFLYGGIRYAGVSDIEGRMSYPSGQPLTDISAHDISFKGGLAWQFNDRFAAGFGAGWFLEKIGSYTGSAFNVDFGVTYKYNRYMSLGASVTNFGEDFYLGVFENPVSDKITIPKTYRFGLSYNKSFMLGALDLVIVDDVAHAHLGAEYDSSDNFMVRAGFMSGYDSKGITVGGSLVVPNYKIVVDYALIPYSNNLGLTHQFNLTYGL